jgi:hypothetical protein
VSSPAVGPKQFGVVFIGSEDGKVYAIYGDSPGLSTTAQWSRFRFDNKGRGRK